MTRFTRDDAHCPRCNSENLFRFRRSWWMRLLGVEKHLRCQSCNLTVLYRNAKRPASNTAGSPPTGD